MEYFGTRIFSRPSSPPEFRLTGNCMAGDPLPPGDRLLATLIFTVWDMGRIYVDTGFYPPSLITLFVTLTHKLMHLFPKPRLLSSLNVNTIKVILVTRVKRTWWMWFTSEATFSKVDRQQDIAPDRASRIQHQNHEFWSVKL